MTGAAASYANPVRSPVRCLRPGRVVQVRFTDFAQLGNAGGLLTMFGPTPDEAVRDLLRRLGVPPGDLQLRAQQLGDVAVLRRMPADAPEHCAPGRLMPIAFVEGLALQDIAEALQFAAPRPAAAA